MDGLLSSSIVPFTRNYGNMAYNTTSTEVNSFNVTLWCKYIPLMVLLCVTTLEEEVLVHSNNFVGNRGLEHNSLTTGYFKYVSVSDYKIALQIFCLKTKFYKVCFTNICPI